MKELNLSGKDYFTIDEAAHYCCVSVSQFSAKATSYNILPFKFMGKVVFRKADLQNIIEQEAKAQWQPLKSAAMRGNLTGRKMARNGV